MSPSNAEYAEAVTKFDEQAWGTFRGHRNWEGHWFSDSSRVELQLKAQLHASNDLSRIAADVIVLDFYARRDDLAVERLDPIEVQVGSQLNALVLILDPSKSPTTITITGMDAMAQLHVECGEPNSSAMPTAHVREAEPNEVHTNGVTLEMQQGGQPLSALKARNSTIAISRPVVEMRLAGACKLLPPHNNVGDLILERESQLQIGEAKSGQSMLSVSTLQVEKNSSNTSAQLLKNSLLIVGSVEDSEIDVAGENATIRVDQFASNVTVGGEGTFVIEDVARKVRFKGDDEGGPTLELAPWAILREASGAVRLGACRNAELNGTEADGLTIASIEQDSGQSSSTEGAIIRNFRVPVLMRGLQTISTLTGSASVAVPLIHPDLPGQRSERKIYKNIRSEPQHFRADYAAALARLAQQRGAPGSTVTKLAWLEYRMREATASGPTERLTLFAYRCIGYGERPGPPLLLWILLGAVFTIVTLLARGEFHRDWSWDGSWNLLSTYFNWLSSPLHVLRLAERDGIPFGSSGPAFAARVAIAVPFITGVLALRKYVKRDHG